MRGHGFSLKWRLLGFVFASILLAAAALGAAAYRSALRDADATFDLHLQQMAHSLRGGVPLGLGFDGDDSGREGYDLFVQIWGPDGTQMFRSARSALPPRAVLGFSDATVGGRRFRVYSLQTPMQTVQIAQDMDAREARARGLALRATWPMALMAPLLMLVVGWIITRSLAPVERMRRHVAQRADSDLSPLSEQGLPDEVRPLVHELNLLFGRVDSAFKAQKNFVADAAHELRSPLTALKLQAEALRRAADPSTRELAITRLQGGIERAIHLVGQLLVLARQESGEAASAAPIGPVRLDDIVAQCVSAALPHAQARGIDLGVVQADPLQVQGDAAALRVLLGNLVDNAVKYAPEGGHVDVTLAGNGTPVLVVEDNGPGIPEAERERAFDRFYRLADGNSTAEGSGLGLAIVRAIADKHGATVMLDRSERLGGLRVAVRFPPAARATADSRS
ncbi:ATP-binding protein [Variovorax sp. OV329]|uniref:ATP-binding protein n=1 Tax=Variovorax sp. OV329 TaxID=1882825 RepID=UPI0008F392E9|nr:ATP-binding protein [Variovorax sp. OV329]SFM10112.1 two-component system, OmpR family, sensor kinase [Variovorax sp. OV329]